MAEPVTDEALRQSEAHFRLMADSAPVLMWMSDETGAGRWFNRSWLEFVGRSLEEELAAGWWTDVHPEDAQRASAQYEIQVAAHAPFTLEYRLRRADGEYRWILDRGVAMWAGADGAFSGYIGTCLDISDRRRSEAMLADNEARFRQLAEDRTQLAELERALRQEAEEANRLKDEFLATLSHELRTPLNAIVGWTTILQQGDVPPSVLSEGIATIERNARMQSQLIEELLDVSRILSGKLRLDVQAFDLAPIVEAAIASVYPAAVAKEIGLNRALISDGAVLLGDPSRLQQVVWNLLSNAVKFTPRGGRVNVWLARVDSHIELRVDDNGQGIAADFLPHVFDRFRQADASTTRAQTGLGLGLAIVRHLVEQHGGTVTAESAGEGKGARFVMRLPIMPVRPALPPAAVESDATLNTPSPVNGHDLLPDLDGLHVLVVDDDQDSRILLKRLLEQRRGVVETAGSVKDAIDALSGAPYDVVISDISMPGQDGYELVRQLRALPGQAALTPAIALTAFARDDDRQRVLRAGFHFHVVKPVDPVELLSALLDVAGRSSWRDQPL